MITPVASPSLQPIAVVRPSLLVSSDRPLTLDQMARLRHARGVTRLTFLGYSPIKVYEVNLNTAAVDVDAFRHFAPP